MKKLYILLFALFMVKGAIGQWFWQNPMPQGNSLYSVYFTDASKGYAVGEYGTILKTTNGGTDWTSQSSGTENWLLSVCFTDANKGYAVGENGTILKTLNGGGYPAGINDHHQSNTNLVIYPNPASLTIAIENTGKGQLYILNLDGHQLLQQEITQPNTTIDVSTLPGGVYVVKLVGNKGVQVGKFVKQ